MLEKLFWGVQTTKTQQGFSYSSEIRTRDLLNLGKKHLDHQNWEEMILDCHLK